MSLKTTVAAVIVTYNRCEKLKNVINALVSQTRPPDRVFVVDNASTDETGRYLSTLATEDARFEHVLLPENIGGAGGFYEGARTAYEEGFEYIWLSDDDAYPEPDALEQLVDAIQTFPKHFNHRPSFACSNVKWTNGDLCEMNTPQAVWDWPRFYRPETPYFLVGACSFVSVLVPRWVFKTHGFPIKDYFIWYDDAEFTQRIAKSYPGIFVPHSIVKHDVLENKGVNYSLVNDSNVWKFRYGARNETSFRKREQGWFGVAIFLRGVRRQMREGRVDQGLRREIYKAIWDGIRFTPKIEHPS